MGNKRVVAGILIVVLVGVAGIAWAVGVLGGDDGKQGAERPPANAETTTTVVPRPDPATSPEAAELYDLITSFTQMTVHAQYRVQVVAQPGQTSVIEIWQKDGKARQEATIDNTSGSSGKVTILDLQDRVVLCQQPANGNYTCGLVSRSEQTSFEALRTNLLAGLPNQHVSVRDDVIGQWPVRCFTVSSPATSELCATTDGVLARVSAPEGSFDLISFDATVDDSVFTPPAQPGATGS